MTTRRDFLRQSLAFGGAGIALSSLSGMSALAQTGSGYKALVCVYLDGGMDGHDTVIPSDAEGYAEWAGHRKLLLETYTDGSRKREALQSLSAQGDGRSFGMPTQMDSLASLYREGNLAVVANVGPLEAYCTRADTEAKRVPLPKRLMSHNDQDAIWHSCQIEGAKSGWGGRMSDIVGDASSPYAAISLFRNPTFLSGNKTRPFQVPTGEIPRVYGMWDRAFGSEELPSILEEHFTASAAGMDSLLASDYMAAHRLAVEATASLSEMAKGDLTGDEIATGDNDLSAQLAMVAKIISMRAELGLSRQVFFVRAGGYDTHSGQAEKLASLQSQLSAAMSRFYAWTESQGVADSVTTFTTAEFGRTLIPNASGTDHGWGNHHLVMGGAVRGGRIVGTIPPSVEKHQYDFGRGRLIPTISTEQYAGALGRWFGLSEGQLADVLPRYGRFDPNAVTLF
ncbi:DUF1501 domain-containing protein [Parvularcula dongshanensis]|uniref:Uncharacterized protein (DUF1501 family) n=1 Tax=Parvularcula dongshanensis TaxID=1173995 RepID=A0A840HYY7_9PROT|nr:DUF1501 domain-containing protein [Parvularcula dongshanensis]MBB4657789.1 uncharacterized protein (DUF1501 family) [Parvularcula dongshanensis]